MLLLRVVYNNRFLGSVTHALHSYLPKMSSADLLKAISCLCVFGHFPQAPLEKLLQNEVLDELLTEGQCSRTKSEQSAFTVANHILAFFSLLTLQPVESPLYARHKRLLRTLALCLHLDHPALPPSVSPVSHLLHPPPQPRPVNPALLITVKKLLGEDVVTDSVVEQGLYFIGEIRGTFFFMLISILFLSDLVPFIFQTVWLRCLRERQRNHP